MLSIPLMYRLLIQSSQPCCVCCHGTGADRSERVEMISNYSGYSALPHHGWMASAEDETRMVRHLARWNRILYISLHASPTVPFKNFYNPAFDTRGSRIDVGVN